MSSNKFREREKISVGVERTQQYQKLCVFPIGIWSINNCAGNTILKSAAELQKVFLRDWGN